MNQTVAGDYDGVLTYEEVKDKRTKKMLKRIVITEIPKGLFKKKQLTYITKDTVDSYEVMTEESEKSVASGIKKGIIGGALLGGVGAVAGATSGKSKSKYMVSVVFKDGTKALCEMDGTMYKQLITIMY